MGPTDSRFAAGRIRPRRSAFAAQRRQRPLAVERAAPALLAAVAEPLEPRDLALALDAGRVIGGQRRDQLRDAGAQLEREVRGGGAHELAHVLDRDLVVGPGAIGMLRLAHRSPTLRGAPIRGARARARLLSGSVTHASRGPDRGGEARARLLSGSLIASVRS